MSGFDPDDLNWRGISTMDYQECEKEMKENNRTILRTSILIVLDFAILIALHVKLCDTWDQDQGILFGIMVGVVLCLYSLSLYCWYRINYKLKYRMKEVQFETLLL